MTKKFTDVMDEWEQAFPALTKYAKSKLYQRVDPFLIGLSLNKDHSSYGVYITVSALWGGDNDTSEWKNFEDYTGISLPLWASDRALAANIEFIKNKYGNILNRDIDLDGFVNVLDNGLRFASNFKYSEPEYIVHAAQVLEFELALSIYFENYKWSEKIWKRIDKDVAKNSSRHPFRVKGWSLKRYLERLRKIVLVKSELMKCAEQYSLRPEIAKLKCGEIVGIDKFKSYSPYQKGWEDKIKTFF